MKTDITINYLHSSITSFKNEQNLKTQIREILRRNAGLEEVDVSLCPCLNIPKGAEIRLVIKNGNIKSTDILRTIEQQVLNLIVDDQQSYRRYRITSIIDNSLSDLSIDEKPIMNEKSEEFDIEKRAKTFVAEEPDFSFDRVILSENIKKQILHALSIIEYKKKVFEEWGLYSIERHPSSALNFYGPSGTGKTMAAGAIAHKLGKKIIKVSYSDVESKYMGEGSKMVRAVFMAAKLSDAVLFIDEADSLLSKRITDISRNGDIEVNGMRSELLMQLEQFEGIVIFATNMISVYDPAVLTRLICVAFENPDADARKRIWDIHLKSEDGSIKIPLSDDVNTKELGDDFEFSGREIKRAVISACLNAVENKKCVVSQSDFVFACTQIKEELQKLKEATEHKVSDKVNPQQMAALKEVVKKQCEDGYKAQIA